jgi:hypothetical protein
MELKFGSDNPFFRGLSLVRPHTSDTSPHVQLRMFAHPIRIALGTAIIRLNRIFETVHQRNVRGLVRIW